MALDIFSTRLELLLKENKTKKKVLAVAIGLTPSAITEMVKGRSNPSLHTIRSIALYYHVSEEWLEHGTGEIMAPVNMANARPANLVPVYGSVPAGWPADQVGVTVEEPIDWIAVEGSTNCIGALRVEGHSMSPEIRDGEYVLYTQDSDLKPGDWIVATDEFRRPMVKEYAIKDGEPWLVSVNPEYPSFKVNHHYQIVGRVIDIYSRRKARRGR